MGIINNFDLFFGSRSFLFGIGDNWGRKLAHKAVDVIDSDLPSMDGVRSSRIELGRWSENCKSFTW